MTVVVILSSPISRGGVDGAVIQSHAEEMRVRLATYCGIVLVMVGLAVACGRQPSVPDTNSDSAQKLPFDQGSRGNGVSPTQSLVPAVTRVPEGTAIAIRLRGPLSSAFAHAGDTFDATTEEPVTNEGQTLIQRGAERGRVFAGEAAYVSSYAGSGSALAVFSSQFRFSVLNPGSQFSVVNLSSCYLSRLAPSLQLDSSLN